MIDRLWVWALVLALTLVPWARAAAQPADGLPAASAWRQHLERDILPFWQTPAALGTPIGNFPSARCNDGTPADPRALCPEYSTAPDWIRGEAGRQYVRMMSRQVYLYGVAFHLTGDPKYLGWAHAGVRYLLDRAFNQATGNIVSYWQAGKAVADPPDRTSQDLAYCLVGLSFYYYLTRDPEVLQAILRIEAHIRNTYYDSRLHLYRWKLRGPDAARVELVAQLDQANAYMVLLTPLLPPPYEKQWRAQLTQIAQTIRRRFYHAPSTAFLGVADPKTANDKCVFKTEDTDFGHTIKAYWMLYLIGRVVGDTEMAGFARGQVPEILRRAYLPATGSWATQPTCDPPPNELDRTSTWWMAAELDQAALTFGIADRTLLAYIPKTFAFWLGHMVDPRYGEVWDEITLPNYTPRLPKVHLWKNGFHTAEHALIGYIATSAVRSEPATLYYAFKGCKIPPVVRPYYYDGRIAAHAETALPEMPGFCRAQVTFADIR